MAFADDLAAMRAVIYSARGVTATWSRAGQVLGQVTLLPLIPEASASSGGEWDERPEATPENIFRVQTSDLQAQSLLIQDVTSRSLRPDWANVTVNYDGNERQILFKPTPADAIRSEWVLRLG